MRLCFIANPYSIHTQRQVRYFADKGHEIHLIGVSPARGTLPVGVLPSNVTYYDFMAKNNLRKLRFLLWGFMARRLVRRIRPDILHAHQVSGSGWVGAATNYHPFLITAWGSDLLVLPYRSQMQHQLTKWTLQQADYVTCVSAGLTQAAGLLGVASDRLEMTPWGVDTDTFKPDYDAGRMAVRANFGLQADTPLVLSIRAVREIYNPLAIAQAIPYVLTQVPEAQFIIRTYSYDQSLLERFKAIIHTHHASESVRYLGDLPDEAAIADLYRASDVVISVPSSDGMPSSVIEALACGATPVLSDLSALRECVTDEQEGLFVALNNAEALGKAVVQLLTNQPLRKKLSMNGIDLVRRRFDSRILMSRVEEIYEQLAEIV